MNKYLRELVTPIFHPELVSIDELATTGLHGWTGSMSDGTPVIVVLHNGGGDGFLETYLLIDSVALAAVITNQPTSAVVPADYHATTNHKKWALLSRVDDAGTGSFGSLTLPEGAAFLADTLYARVNVIVGLTGSAMKLVKSVSASLNFGSIAAGAEATLTITVTGATTTSNPSVALGWSAALEDGIVVKQAWVSAADTVSIRVRNETGSSIDPAAVTCRATVTHF